MDKNSKQVERAVFGGGCFWCTEAVFKMLKGVKAVLPGYSGGSAKNPTYSEVSEETSGHVEVIEITYDPDIITYQNLLTVFFGSHDPTSVNRQGNDVGTHYRSVIFYTTLRQKEEAEKLIEELNQSHTEGKAIATQVEPFEKFYEAENSHRDYYAQNKSQPYCQLVINPKLEKVQKNFAELLKENEN